VNRPCIHNGAVVKSLIAIQAVIVVSICLSVSKADDIIVLDRQYEDGARKAGLAAELSQRRSSTASGSMPRGFDLRLSLKNQGTDRTVFNPFLQMQWAWPCRLYCFDDQGKFEHYVIESTLKAGSHSPPQEEHGAWIYLPAGAYTQCSLRIGGTDRIGELMALNEMFERSTIQLQAAFDERLSWRTKADDDLYTLLRLYDPNPWRPLFNSNPIIIDLSKFEHKSGALPTIEAPMKQTRSAGRGYLSIPRSAVKRGDEFEIVAGFENTGQTRRFFNPFFLSHLDAPGEIRIADALGRHLGVLKCVDQPSRRASESDAYILIPSECAAGLCRRYVSSIVTREGSTVQLKPGEYSATLVLFEHFSIGTRMGEADVHSCEVAYSSDAVKFEIVP